MVYYNINEELFRIIEIFDKLQEVYNITLSYRQEDREKKPH